MLVYLKGSTANIYITLSYEVLIDIYTRCYIRVLMPANKLWQVNNNTKDMHDCFVWQNNYMAITSCLPYKSVAMVASYLDMQ